MSGPVEVTADLGTVKVVPFGAEQVQLRCKVRLGRTEPLETVLLLNRTQALQIAAGLTSGDLVELIEAARKVCASKMLDLVNVASLDWLAEAVGKFVRFP